MPCDNINLPSALDSSGQPFFNARLIDLDCGCSATIPSATNCVPVADIERVDPAPELDGSFVIGNGEQAGTEFLVATINTLQCCDGNQNAVEALPSGATVDTVFASEVIATIPTTTIVTRWRRGTGTDSGKVYAQLVFLDPTGCTATTIDASSTPNPFSLCGTLPGQLGGSTVYVTNAEITIA